MQKVIIIGGVGNGTVIARAIKDANSRGVNEIVVEGYFSDRIPPGELIEGLPVIAKTSKENIQIYIKKGYKFIYTVLRIDGQQERLGLYSELNITDESLAVFVHPLAYVAPNVKLAPGTVLMPYVSVSSGTKFGKSCLVMVGAIIGENISFGNFCHVAAQACLGSNLKIGEGVHIGLNSAILENVSIGDYSTIGMGAILSENIDSGEIWAGNPAKFLRKAK